MTSRIACLDWCFVKARLWGWVPRVVRSIGRHTCTFDRNLADSSPADFHELAPVQSAAWLMRIVKRQAVQAARKRRPIAPLESIAEPMDPIEGEELQHGHECLMELVNRLPLHERLVFTSRYLDGHRPGDIAAMTGRPLDTVKKQLSRALVRLRRWALHVESGS